MNFKISSFLGFLYGYLAGFLLQVIVFHPLDFGTFLTDINYQPPDQDIQIWSPQSFLMTLIPVFGGNSDLAVNANAYYYIQYIIRQDGLHGIYRGIEPKIIEHIILNPICQIIWLAITGKKYREGEMDLSDELWYQTLRIIMTQPMYVTMVASFIDFTKGQNNNMPVVMRNIYDKKCYKGFYLGVVERICGEMVFHVLRASISRLLCLEKKDANNLQEIVLMILRDAMARWISLPFHVLSHKTIARALM